VRQLTPLDAQFLALESGRAYGHVSGLAVLDPSTAPGGRIERADICRMVSERIHLLPPFRWKKVDVPFGLDHPYWVEDPDFDLDFHIRETAVPPPGGKRQLAEQIARIVARPLDRSRPLWELYLIHGIDGDKVGTLTKIHHAVVDGVSGAEILSVLVDTDPAGRELPPRPDDCCGERVPGQLEMLGRGLLAAPLQPLRALRAAPTALPHLDAIPGVGMLPARLRPGRSDAVLEAAPRAPRTRFNDRISPHRRFAYGAVSLPAVKRLKNALGITVNDVVVGAIAGAMRRWLLERDELPEEPLVAMVPVSVRTKEQFGTYGNRVSAMIVPIPTDEADPRRRLERAHEVMASAKTRHQATPATLMQDASQFVPPALFNQAARTVAQVGAVERLRPMNLVISNVPGPPIPLYMAGARMLGHFPVSVIVDGVGLNITCMSYLDQIDFGIVADREQVDDAWPLLAAVQEEVGALEALLPPDSRRAAREVEA
jgi:diacylglycerol O-acyltransferase / wax synthase